MKSTMAFLLVSLHPLGRWPMRDQWYVSLGLRNYTSFQVIIYFIIKGWCTSWLIFYDKNGYASGIKEGVGNMCQLYLHSNTFLMNSLPDLFERLGVDYATKCIP